MNIVAKNKQTKKTLNSYRDIDIDLDLSPTSKPEVTVARDR